jgi:cell wall-associated NlpC family hydrolase
MKPFLVLLALLSVVPGMAQLRKAESCFKKGEFDRCLIYCQQAKPGQNKEEYRQIKVYQCWSYLSLYKKTPSKFSYLDQALQVHRTEKFTKAVPTAEVSALLLNTLRNTSDSLHRFNNKNLAKKYVKIQASQFKDTSSLYAVYYPPVVKTSPATVKKEVEKKEIVRRISRPELLKYSEQFLNIPYKWAGEDSSGLDCSGFVTKVFRRFGYHMAHGAKDQSELGQPVERAQLKPGDLVFFGKRYDTGRCKIDHVAIVHEVSNSKLMVIHSTSKGVNIQEMKMEEYWGKKILFYRNFIDHFVAPETNRL